ncbi:MAG: nitroreductase [Gemmatimonadota bacterium]|nr:nitroreductase [Gemmatimonadota bacterium]
MTAIDAIRARRSTRKFTDTPVAREQVETLLALAVLAPNHRMSQPWRFLVLGPAARAAYGTALGIRKSRKIEDPAMAQATRDRTLADAVGGPLMIAVVQTLSDNPEILEEDYAATWMGIQNIMLGAVELGLGTHLRTGAVFGDASVKEAWGVADGERVVGIMLLGHPDGTSEAKARVSAAERTVWLA